MCEGNPSLAGRPTRVHAPLDSCTHLWNLKCCHTLMTESIKHYTRHNINQLCLSLFYCLCLYEHVVFFHTFLTPPKLPQGLFIIRCQVSPYSSCSESGVGIAQFRHLFLCNPVMNLEQCVRSTTSFSLLK